MKYNQYVSLIQELEQSAAASKGWYEFRVFLLIALGYGYFVGLILLLIAPIAVVGLGVWFAPGQVWSVVLQLAKLWWILVPGLGLYFGFLGSAVRAITAKAPFPEGTELKPSDAPKLFSFVRETCKELKARKPKKILVDDSFNAAVVTMPRFGIFGRKVVILLGLPLMKSLSPKQFEAVLAHEIGHISGKHGSFAKWAYQMREAWGRLIDAEETTGHKFSTLYKKFVEWFFPFFTAYSFVLMREHEKEADREAARLIGSKELGEALILLETKARSLNEDYWVSIHKENIANAVPTKQIFSRMLAFLADPDPAASNRSFENAVAVKTDFSDTHPSLADRLRLIGYWTDGELPNLPEPPKTEAAIEFLGSEIERLTAQFNEAWDQQAAEKWNDRHEHFRESQKRVDALEEKRGLADLTFGELREMAQLNMENGGIAAAMPVIEEAANKFPDEALAWFDLGGGRLAMDDETGLAYLEKATGLDAKLKYEAYQAAFTFLKSKGRNDEAAKYISLLEEQEELYEKAEAERKTASPSDQFGVHDLSIEFIDSIPRKLAGLDEVTAIFAANKIVTYFPDVPFRVLFIELRGKQKGDSDAKNILDIITDRLNNGEVNWFTILDANWGIAGKAITEIPGARVYAGISEND